MNHPHLEVRLAQVIDETLSKDGLQVHEVSCVPPLQDPILRIQTLEEIIREFESPHAFDSRRPIYVIQLGPQKPSTPAKPPTSDLDSFLAPTSHQSEDDLLQSMVAETYQGSDLTVSPYLPSGELNGDLVWDQAMVLAQAEENTLALQVLDSLLKAKYDPARVHFWMGVIQERLKHGIQALEHYRMSLAFDPKLKTSFRLSTLLVQEGQFAEAEGLLLDQLRSPELTAEQITEIYTSIGLCQLKQNKKQEAIQSLERALELSPHDERVIIPLVNLQREHKRHAEVRRLLTEIHAYKPSAKFMTLIAESFYDEGNIRSAHDAFLQSLDLNLDQPDVLYKLVKCAFQLKSYAPAARVLEQYIDAHPIHANLLYTLAGLQYHLGRTDDASDTLERLFKIVPEHGPGMELAQRIK